MATYYTAPIEEGNDVTLAAFAWRCSRAFCDPDHVDHRDGCLTLKHYEDGLASAHADVARYDAMTLDESADELAANKAMLEDIRVKHQAERDINHARYQAMIASVEAWNAPGECAPLRDFMLQQLRQEDAYHAKPVDYCDNHFTAVEWLDYRRKSAAKDVAYYAERLDAYRLQEAERRAFMQALTASVGEAPRQ